MTALPKLLSKTRLMRGYQCLKGIFLTVHHKELEAPISSDLQAIFDQGNMVGAEARKRYPKGVLVDNPPWDFFGSLKRTRELLKNGTEVIFEAAFEYKGCFARSDIIAYSKETKRWSVFEVKSTTSVKDEHLDDVGLQAWIMANAGLPIEKISIMHLNRDCRYPSLDNLFVDVDVTEDLRERHNSIPQRLNEIFKTIRSESIPEIDIGAHCHSPNQCAFVSHCWKDIPTPSIFNLPGIWNRKWDLYSEGIVTLDDPRLKDLTPTQERAIEAFKTNRRYVDHSGIKARIADWRFPLIFLDFETINPAIPRYDGTRPYQQVPFQFSAHVLQALDSELVHNEYLHTDAADPRPNLIPKLLDACKGPGSIVAYNSKFEAGRVTEMAEQFPDHRPELEALLDRFVDPLPIFREFVYDNGFAGSFSLKSVAPSILGNDHSYEGMLVGDGSAAQRAFDEIISPVTPLQRRKALIAACLEYCKKDTLVMVDLTKWLFQQAELSQC